MNITQLKANEAEQEANAFARELLMPERAFRGQIDTGNNTVVGLASFFQCSTIAIRTRAKELGLRGHGLERRTA